MNLMTMKRSVAATMMLGILTTANAVADSVLYKDNELTISDAIVMEGETPRYYQQVRLTALPNGDFRIVDAVEKQLAYINEVSVAVLEKDPVEVELNIAGDMSTPCVELNTTVSRRDDTFYVVVGETPLQTLVACIQVLKPFEMTLPLDVQDLPAGDYRVVVNGEETDFTID